MSSALEQAEKLIPAEVRMISGCKDSQTSADVSNVARCVYLPNVDTQQTPSEGCFVIFARLLQILPNALA